MATQTSLTFAIFGRYHGSAAFRQARRDLNDAETALRRTSKRCESLAGKFNLVTTAAVSLLPALIPIGAQLASMGAGFLAVSVAAGAAGGIWAIALKGAITEAGKWQKEQAKANKEVDSARKALSRAKPGTDAYKSATIRLNQALKAQKDLGKSMPKMYKEWNSSVGRLHNAWNTFIRSMAPATMGPALVVMGGITNHIRDLEPVVKAMHPVMAMIASDIRSWMDSGGVKRLVDLIVKYGVPAFKTFYLTGKNIVGVLGRGFRDFLPTGMNVVKQLQRGSAALKSWSDGGGFQRFLGYVKANSGQLGQFWKALLGALMNIAKAMKDVAPLSLLIATALAKMLAALPPAVITMLVQAFVAWKAAMLGLLIINNVIRAVQMAKVAFLTLRMVMFLFPGLWIVLAIAAVVTAIVLIATKTTWFQTAWKYTWNAVKAVGAAIWSFLGGKFKWLILIIGPIGWLLLLWKNWRAVWSGIRTATSATWHFIHDKIFEPIVKFHTVIIPNSTKAVGRAVKAGWDAMWRGIKGAYNSIVRNVFSPIGRFFTRTIPNWGTTLRKTVVHAFALMASGIQGQWNKLEGIAKKPVKFFVNTVYNNGLRKAWNNTAGKIPGVPDLPHASLPFNSGGPVRGFGTGTSDSINARLSHGEFVVRAKAVRQIGVPALNRLNSMGGSQIAGGRSDYQPGYALGGIHVPNPVDLLKKAGGAAFGAVKWGASVIKSIGSKALSAMFGPIKSLIKKCTSNFRDSGMIGKAVQQNALRAIPAMIKFAVSHMSDGGGANVMKALAWARTQVGKPYQWGGNGNPSWDCSGFMSAIESVIRGQKPHRRWATGSFPPGAPGWKRNLKSPFSIGITNAGVGHTAGTLAGVNVECRGGKGVIVGGGARGANDGLFTSRWGFEGAMGSAAGGNAQNIAKSMLGQFGWGMQYWPALNSLWQRESGWNPLAKNASSGAYGIPQALPGSKMASAGSDWRTNPATQIKWGLGYIRSVYGNPNVAWSKWQSRSPHWYNQGGEVKPMLFDDGGYLPKGVSLVNNQTGHPEPLKRVGRNHGSGDDVNVTFNDCVFSGSKKQFENLVVGAVNEAKRKKRL